MDQDAELEWELHKSQGFQPILLICGWTVAPTSQTCPPCFLTVGIGGLGRGLKRGVHRADTWGCAASILPFGPGVVNSSAAAPPVRPLLIGLLVLGV